MHHFLKKKKLHLTIITLMSLTGIGVFTYKYKQKSTPQVSYVVIPEAVPGKIITLKKLSEQHIIDYHNMLSNIVRKNLEFPRSITLSWTIAEIKYELEEMKRGKRMVYAIFDNKEDKLVGAITLMDKDPREPGQLGVWINEHYWGGGRFQEALHLASRVFFDVRKTDSYIAHVRLWNKRSYHALKKVGFKDVGFYLRDGVKTRHILKFERKNLK